MKLGTRFAILAAVAALVATALAGPAAAATATLSIPYRGCVGGDGRNYDYTLRVQGSTGYYSSGIRVEAKTYGPPRKSSENVSSPQSRASTRIPDE